MTIHRGVDPKHIHPDKLIPPKTTAADLIAQLSKLPPDTPVSVDIGNHDWDTSHLITVEPISEDYPDRAGEYHLNGTAEWELR